jgi:hypothetical protein
LASIWRRFHWEGSGSGPLPLALAQKWPDAGREGWFGQADMQEIDEAVMSPMRLVEDEATRGAWLYAYPLMFQFWNCARSRSIKSSGGTGRG